MKLSKSDIQKLVREELEGKRLLHEGLANAEINELRGIIRREVALIFFDLFRKRSTWGALK